MTTATLTIDPEFQALIPPLSAEERQQLEANLLADGCRDALVVWNDTLVDGHNRYEICTRLDIPFAVEEMVFESREIVIDWIISNQLGRRNLSPDNFTRFVGMKYNRAKKQGERTDLTYGQNDHKSLDTTANKIADKHGVSEATVRRAGRAVDTVETQAVPEIQAAVQAGTLPVRTAAKVAALPVEKQREVAAAPEPKRAAKEALGRVNNCFAPLTVPS